MKLNDSAYVHKLIRMRIGQLEILTGLKLSTNLSEEFKIISLMNRYSYIVIDLKKYGYKSLAHKITPLEESIIEEILIYWNWLCLGEKFNKKKGRKHYEKK